MSVKVSKLFALTKITAVFALIGIYLVTTACARAFGRDPIDLKKLRSRIHSRFCAWGLKVLGVRVGMKNATRFFDAEKSARLMVGNHMSYLDILVLASLYPSNYVTSQEIRETPFLGMLCEAAGCLFVERRNKEQIHKEVGEITQALAHGLNVTIFPEATSTNGEEILRFRSPLYQAALDANAIIQPFCLNYKSIDGVAFSKANRDLVCWYGDMGFLSHLWELCRCGSVEAEVVLLEEILPLYGACVKQLATRSQAMVAEVFIPAH